MVFGVRSQFPCDAPEGRDKVEGNLCSDPENARFRILSFRSGSVTQPFGLRYRSLALNQSPGFLMSPDAALSPRRATHLFLLRQNKVSQKKATLVPAEVFWGQSPNSRSL